MGSSINKVTIIGNLGKDPELRFMPNGEAVANITVATSETWKDKATGAKQEATEWHKVVFFRSLAEVVGKYLHKGSKIYVEGKLKTRKWKDKGGVDHYTTEIVCHDMKMLDSRPSSAGQPAAVATAEAPADLDFNDSMPDFSDVPF